MARGWEAAAHAATLTARDPVPSLASTVPAWARQEPALPPGAWSASGCRVPIHGPARTALGLHPQPSQQRCQGAKPSPSEDAPASGDCPAPKPCCWILEGAGGPGQ